MAISIRLENPPGTIIPSYRLTPGQPLRITGTCRGMTGIPAGPFFTVSIRFENSFGGLYWQTATNIAGNYWIDIEAIPNAVTTAVISAGWRDLLGSWDWNAINVGIGTEPPPQPAPEPSTLDRIISMVVMIIILVIMVRAMGGIGGLLGGGKD